MSQKDYFNLYHTNQSNPSADLYELLILGSNNNNKDDFIEKSKQVIFHNLNIPLIKGNERLRLNLYKYRIATTQKDLNEFHDIIIKMEEIFKSNNPENKEMNLQIYLFLIGLFEIDTEEKMTWFENFFLHLVSPLEQLNLEKSQFKNDFVLYKNRSLNNKIKITIEDVENYTFRIENKFEYKIFNGKNYCINNLIKDFSANIDAPLEILLKRNESFEYFNLKKRQIIDEPTIYQKFKEYFNLFIHSKLVKEVLGREHKNIIELIESDKFSGFSLDNEFVKSVPLYNGIAQGYTDKQIIISLISYFPILIENYGQIYCMSS